MGCGMTLDERTGPNMQRGGSGTSKCTTRGNRFHSLDSSSLWKKGLCFSLPSSAAQVGWIVRQEIRRARLRLMIPPSPSVHPSPSSTILDSCFFPQISLSPRQCRIQKIIGPLSAQMSVEYDPLLVLCTQNSLSAKLHQERGMQECRSFGGEVATTVWSVRLIDQC